MNTSSLTSLAGPEEISAVEGQENLDPQAAEKSAEKFEEVVLHLERMAEEARQAFEQQLAMAS